MCTLWQDLSNGTINFEHVTLTVTFDLLLKNFNIGHNLFILWDKAFIFGMCVPCDKAFPMVPYIPIQINIIRKVSSCSFHYAEINGPNQNIQWQFELPRSENRQKILGWHTVFWSQMRQVFINIPTISIVSTWSTFPSLENLERLRDPPNRFWETGDTAQRIGFRRFTEWPLGTCAS